MIEARCLSCGHQQAVDEFVAEGGKVGEPFHARLLRLPTGKYQRVREGICWRCDRERRARAMTGAQ